MSKELVISSNRHETRVAMLEDDQVVEVYHQRENEYSLAGSIHKGRVTRVLPGMQSAFVDIGLDRDAFLYVSDFFEDNEEYDKIVTSVEDKVLKLDRTPPVAIVAAPPAPVEAVPAADTAEPAAVVETSVTAEPDLPATSVTVAEVAPPEPEQRRDDRDRDRRGGRRSRRRRGQRGGRALPDSKFYSPGHHAAEPAPPLEPRVPEPAEPGVSASEDLLVLPGERSPSTPARRGRRRIESRLPAKNSPRWKTGPKLPKLSLKRRWRPRNRRLSRWTSLREQRRRKWKPRRRKLRPRPMKSAAN